MSAQQDRLIASLQRNLADAEVQRLALAEEVSKCRAENAALLNAFPEYGATEAEGNLRRAAPDLLALADRWLRIMGKAGADKCGCRPEESYVCCRCDVVATISKARGSR